MNLLLGLPWCKCFSTNIIDVLLYHFVYYENLIVHIKNLVSKCDNRYSSTELRSCIDEQ